MAISDDFGQSWAVSSTNLPQEWPVYSFENDYVYVRMSSGIFRAHLSAPAVFSRLFMPSPSALQGGGVQFLGIMGDAVLACGQGDVYRSFDSGNTWLPPVAAPNGSTNIAPDGRTVLEANGRFWLPNDAGVWRFEPDIPAWQRMVASDFYVSPRVAVLESPDNLLLGTRNGKIVYSPDLGGTWTETTDSPVYLGNSSLRRSGERVFVLNNQSLSWLGSGNTWSHKSVPGLNNVSSVQPQLFFSGDTIALFRQANAGGGVERFLSFDAGETWQQETLTHFLLGQLINFDGRLLNFTQAGFSESLNFGNTWTNIIPGQSLPPYYTTPAAAVPPRVVARQDSIFFINSDKGLRYTVNLGASWTVVDQTPFSATVTATISGVLWSDEIPASATYYTRDGYLYAFTQKHGIFRASLEPITGQAPVSVDPVLPQADAGGIGLRVFPNPASGALWLEMDLPQAMHIRMEVFDLMGRCTGVLSAGAFFPQGKHLANFDIAPWPDGVYLLHLRGQGRSAVQQFIKKSGSR